MRITHPIGFSDNTRYQSRTLCVGRLIPVGHGA